MNMRQKLNKWLDYIYNLYNFTPANHVIRVIFFTHSDFGHYVATSDRLHLKIVSSESYHVTDRTKKFTRTPYVDLYFKSAESMQQGMKELKRWDIPQIQIL